VTDLISIGKRVYLALRDAEEAVERAKAAMSALQTEASQASAETGLGAEIPAYLRTAQEALGRSAAATTVVHRRLEVLIEQTGVEPSAIGVVDKTQGFSGQRAA